MSIGALQTEADLQRWLGQQLAIPSSFSPRAISGVTLVREAITEIEISTGAVTARQIAAGTITAEQIAAETILGDNIAAGTLEGKHLKAGTITAELLEVTQLSAISADLGTVTAGTLEAVSLKGSTVTGGTIKGVLLEGNTIKAGQLVAGSVTAKEISVADLAAISASLGKVTSGEIVGTTIKTATANPKVQMDSAGITGWDVGGTAKFHFDTATGILYAEGVLGAEDGSVIPTKVLAGKIKETQIEEGAISTPLLAANSVTAAKIVAGTITGTNIATGTITAEKLSVATLSAITANLGTVTAGTVKGVTLEGTTIKGGTISGTTIEALEAFKIRESGPLEEAKSMLAWYDKEGNRRERIFGRENVESQLVIQCNQDAPRREKSLISIAAFNESAAAATLELVATKTSQAVKAGGLTLVEGEKSSFLQLTETAKRKINFGEGTFTFTASTKSAALKVTHGLGATPVNIQLTNISTNGGSDTSAWVISGSVNSSTFECQAFNATSFTGTIKFYWQVTG